ncbi:MAG: hypothetical protein LDL41_19655 [Coleofasciculus sp. S288]|nr:hypothetical protein [Coleofasciculus sp. S288]
MVLSDSTMATIQSINSRTSDGLRPQLREQVFKEIVLAMLPRDWKPRVEDKLQAMTEIQSLTDGMPFEDFQANTQTVRATEV